MQANTFCTGPVECRIGQVDVPESLARPHPFVDVVSGPATELTLVTVLTMGREGESLPSVAGKRDGAAFAITVGTDQVTVRDGTLSVG